MSGYDDSVLRDQLQRLGGHYLDDDIAYTRLQQRVRIAKRRRVATVMTGLGAICVLGFGAVALSHNGDTHRLSPLASSREPDNSNTTLVGINPSPTAADDSSTTATTDPASTAATDTATTAAPTTAAPTTPATEATTPVVIGNGQTQPTNTPTTHAASGKGSGGSGSSGNGSGSSGGSGSGTGKSTTTTASTQTTEATSTSASPSTPDSGPQTFTTAGGNVTVKVQNAALVLVSDPAADGFTARITSSRSDRIRVEFSNGHRLIRVEVNLDHGQVTHSITDQNSGDGLPSSTTTESTVESAPGGGSHGGGTFPDGMSHGPGPATTVASDGSGS